MTHCKYTVCEVQNKLQFWKQNYKFKNKTTHFKHNGNSKQHKAENTMASQTKLKS